MPRGSMYGGKFFESIGAYPVYPGLKNYEKSLKNHFDAIKHGRSVGIFPMGKIHTIDNISQARGGVSYLAYKTGLPIIPMKIDCVADSKLIDYLKFNRRMTIIFGEPLYTNDIFGKSSNLKSMKSHYACEKAAVVIMKKITQLK